MKQKISYLVGIAAIVAIIIFASSARRSPADSGGAIKIGQMSALTDVGSDIGIEERNGAILAIERLNKEGGIAGRHIQLISEDTPAFDLKKGASVINKLISSDGVVAIIGPQWDSEGEVVAAISAARKVPVVSQNVSTDIESKVNSPYFFETWPDDEVGIRADLNYARSRGWKKIAIIEPANFSFWLFTANLFKKNAPEYGITVVAEEMGTDFNNVDYRTLISKAKVAKPDAFFGSYADLECVFLKQTKEQGIAIPFLSTDSALNVKALWDCANDMQGRLYFSTPNRGNGFDQFVIDYQTRFGQKPLASSAATAYNAGLVLGDVMKKLAAAAKEINRENIKDALKMEKFEGGVSIRTIQFNEKGFLVTPVDAFEIQTVKDGKFVKAD